MIELDGVRIARGAVLIVGAVLALGAGPGVADAGSRDTTSDSAENLELTWKPQVQVKPGASYALGWGVAAYKGLRLLTHNGGTYGFTSNLSFLPDGNLGVAVLCNAENRDEFVAAIPFRVFELVYGQPEEYDPRLAQVVRKTQEAGQDLARRAKAGLEPGAISRYFGAYSNDRLGEAALTKSGARLMLHLGSFDSELRAVSDSSYVLWDPPIAGTLIQLDPGGGSWRLVSTDPEEPGSYPFTRAGAPPTR